jgi:uncharacterized coiled-coil protein SlyX
VNDEAWLTALVGVFVALVGFAGGVLARRASRPLADAQADKAEVETFQIVDDIARRWIEELRDKVAEQEQQILALRAELASQRAAHRHEVQVLVKHIGVLEHHINDRKPPPPPPMPALGT